MANHDINLKVKTTGAEKSTSSMNKLTGALKGVALGYGALVIARKSIQFISSATNQFFKQSSALSRMGALLKLVPDYYDGMAKSFTSLSEKLQKTGIIADDTTQAFIGQMASFKLSGENIKKMIPAVQDYIAATYGMNASQESAIMTANTLGKAFMGQAGMLARTGVIMSDAQKKMLNTGNQAEQTATIIDVLNDNYRGLNKELAKTPEGKRTQMLQAMGDAMEAVGKAFWEKGKMGDAMEAMKTFFTSDAGGTFAENIGKAFGSMLKPLNKILVALGLIEDAETRLNKITIKEGEDIVAKFKQQEKRLKELDLKGAERTPKEERDYQNLKDTRELRRKSAGIAIQPAKEAAKRESDKAWENLRKKEKQSTVFGMLESNANKIPFVKEQGNLLGDNIATVITPVLDAIVFLKRFAVNTSLSMREVTNTIQKQDDDIVQNTATLKTIQDRQ